MKVKVCGMRDPENIRQAANTGVDLMGYIFYKGSSRYMENLHHIETEQVHAVGVFVNENPDIILSTAQKWKIKTIQLHGNETPEECLFLKENGLVIVKAFPVGNEFEFSILEPYLEVIDFILFDTKGPKYGGNGQVFNWELLADYPYNVPFWLSGGIHPGMAKEIKLLDFPNLYAVDVNSGFEESPGIKNIHKLKNFIDELHG